MLTPQDGTCMGTPPLMLAFLAGFWPWPGNKQQGACVSLITTAGGPSIKNNVCLEFLPGGFPDTGLRREWGNLFYISNCKFSLSNFGRKQKPEWTCNYVNIARKFFFLKIPNFLLIKFYQQGVFHWGRRQFKQSIILFWPDWHFNLCICVSCRYITHISTSSDTHGWSSLLSKRCNHPWVSDDDKRCDPPWVSDDDISSTCM